MIRLLQKMLCCFFVLLCGCASQASDQSHSSRLQAQNWQRATQAVVDTYAPVAEARLKPYFQRASVQYPPKNVAILAFKNERRVELWASNAHKNWHFIRHYPLTAFSGQLGPKLKVHDGQIPEGVYRIGFLDPFSRWHLSMKINYPNEYDLSHAKQDGRKQLGGDIFIHGKAASIGCLAVGDEAIEELFVLLAKVGVHAAKVIIAPNDLRRYPAIAISSPHPLWITDLDQRLAQALTPFSESISA